MNENYQTDTNNLVISNVIEAKSLLNTSNNESKNSTNNANSNNNNNDGNIKGSQIKSVGLKISF